MVSNKKTESAVMLLVFTESRNTTADLLFERFGHSAFRLNSDLWRDYRLELRPDGWKIENPAGLQITSETATHAFWWKPWMLHKSDDDAYLIGEIKYVFRELYAWCLRRDAIVGTVPDFHNKFGKLAILDIASHYFRVPTESVVCWNFPISMHDSVVAKSLASEGTNDGRILYTASVATRRIDPKYPWFLQSRIDANSDVTVVVCGHQFFAFSRPRNALKGLDWRRWILDADPETLGWHPRTVSDAEHTALRGFCDALDVQWGRLDFLEDDNGLVFLEFNASGQWAWLDLDAVHGLMNAVVKYLLTPPGDAHHVAVHRNSRNDTYEHRIGP